jgi:molybdate transport repressor ModE-like protein
MKTGAIIITAGRSSHSDSFRPMLKIGAISAVRRLIQTFLQAGADPVVLVLDKESEDLRKQLSYTGAVCLENDAPATQMIDYAKVGLAYLSEMCDQGLITPVDIPLFTVHTVQLLMRSGAQLASPSCNSRCGHPLLIARELIPHFLAYQGENGLRGAIAGCGCSRTLVDVSDEGILFDIELKENYEELLSRHNRQTLHPEVSVQLVKEKPFFGPETAQLLSLIENTGCVSLACRRMNISYSKGWKIIRDMESQLGDILVERQQGGKAGGGACLTLRGKRFLDTFYEFNDACQKAAQTLYEDYFAKI